MSRLKFTGDTLNGLPVLPGTCQQDRLAQALRPDWFHLEERSVDTLLAMSGKYASKLCFHNAQNVTSGDWNALFQQDECAVIADFLNFRSESEEEDFLRTLDLNPEAAAEKIFGFAKLLEAWLGRLSGLHSHRAEAMMTQLGAAAGQLVKELDSLQSVLVSRRKSGSGQEQNSCQCPSLRRRAGQDCKGSSAASDRAGHVGTVRAVILQCHAAFQQVIGHLQALAPALWKDSLRSGQHEPAVGLFIAFLQLYSKAAAKGRSFPERHIDFYYWDVLRAGARLPQPDCVHLVCRNVVGQEVLIRQGDRFTAGSDAAGDERLYLAENDLRVTDARVERLFSLSFERDKFVSPAWEMGCFTRCSSRDLSIAAEPQPGSGPTGLSLFGTKENSTSRQDAKNVQLGLMLAAPELLLSQGRREISIILQCRQEASPDDLLRQMEETIDQEHFFALFGQLLSLHLTKTVKRNIVEPVRERVLRAAESVGIATALTDVIDRLLHESSQGNTLFYRFLTNAFHISLSRATGWLAVKRYLIFPAADTESGCGGLRLTFTLDRDVEPVIGCRSELHGAICGNTSLPLLRLRLNHQSNFFAYSIFRHFILEKIILETKAEGLRDLQVHNQHGRLDPAQPFQPFGPAPAHQSYFIVGSHEAACKQLTDLSFCLEWAELPDVPEGFAAYYRQYGDASLTNASFQASFSLLRHGRWVPEAKEQRRAAALFAWRGMDGRLEERQILTACNLKEFRSISTVAAGDFLYSSKQSNGFFRWELAGPRQAFGHSQYPELLSKVLVFNARSKRLKLPVPNPPYTPLIKTLSLNYTARCEIDLSKQTEGSVKLYHLHPFGRTLLYPQTVRKPHALVPEIGAAGNLYIGLRSQEFSGVQTLYFHLNADSGRTAADEPCRISWFYATDRGWRPFEESQLLGDTTEHFLHSGIITLNIPDEISQENEEMGQGLYWLRASTDNNFNAFATVRGVYAQALRAVAPQGSKAAEPLAPQTVRRPFSTITGLAEVLQPEASFNGGRLENREAVITRLSERLRHKNRAVTSWDYERLVLEQFPQIRQVKCFPHLRTAPEAGHYPGSVLVVVVPEAARQASCAVLPKADAAILTQIRDFLRQHASPFSGIEVRNPEYEQIQVRCAVFFADRSSSGSRLVQLNQAIFDYISPWTSTGFNARFGWSLRLDDISAYLSKLDGVEHVTDLSVLHITKDVSNAYYLADSARDVDAQNDQIRPRYPWSIAVPMQQHFIRVLNKASDAVAKGAGINELQIGETFIINE